MSTLAEELLKELTTRPQPRGYLSWVLQCTDNELRAAVRELRDNGYEDTERTIRELRAKAFTLIKRANALEAGLDKGQVEWTTDGQAEWLTKEA